jgi:hypothetical protein
MTEVEIEKVLDAIELVEYPLLNWGITNGVLSSAELDLVIASLVAPAEVANIRDEMLRRRLVFMTPDGNFRSRIAEYLRLTMSLRQWFPGQKSEDAQILVHDMKFHARQRYFPKRDLAKDEVFSALNGALFDVPENFLRPLLPEKLSSFQFRSIQSVLSALSVNENKSIVVTAGTGSGKTNAYFLPMLAWLAQQILVEGHKGVRTLTLYPRVELLKDQLGGALSNVRRLNQSLEASHPSRIRIGVWYGEVKRSLKDISAKDGWKKVQLEGGIPAYRCPFLRCEKCIDSPDMVILEASIKKKSARLQCPNQGCDFVVSNEDLSFTRDEIENTERGVDVLFTTTESLNRQLASSKGRFAFGLSPSSSLRTILIDEAHVYEGQNGAQTAYLFRRLRHRVQHPLAWVSLSATLENPKEFIKDLLFLETEVVEPNFDEMEMRGAEYIVAVRHYLESKKSPLSTSIQMAMLMSRILDARSPRNVSDGFFGTRMFAFGDKLDVVNRLYFNLANAEGFSVDGAPARRNGPRSLATLRSENQPGQSPLEPAIDRFDSGQWWKISEDLGHQFGLVSGKKIARTSSQQRGVSKDAEIIVATASLEVGFDDQAVGAVLQHKMPRSVAGFLQRKGRAGRTQKMRPLTTIVLSPFGKDKAAWSNAESFLFQPKLPARRLPMSNRYTQKMQAVYALLDWVATESTIWDSWSLLSGKYWKEDKRPQRDSAVLCLHSLLMDPSVQIRFGSYLQEALCLSPVEVDGILWSQPRGLLTTVVPTALRRLESEFSEDAGKDDSPLREFAPPNLFTELSSPEVLVSFPNKQGNSADDDTVDFLPLERVLREFTPGNTSRHFGYKESDRHWIPIESGVNGVDVLANYGAIDSGLRVDEDGEQRAIYIPQFLKLSTVPFQLGEGTKAYAEWGIEMNAVTHGQKFVSRIMCWDGQNLKLDVYLHSNGSNVHSTRYSKRSRGWTSPRSGSKQRIDVQFEALAERVFLGMDLEVDGLSIGLSRPSNRPEVTPSERLDRFVYLITNDEVLAECADAYELERICESLVSLIAQHGGYMPIISLSDLDLMNAIFENGQASILDQLNPDVEVSLDWLSPEFAARIREHLAATLGKRDDHWEVWFDKRVALALGKLVVDVCRELIVDLDCDDLVVDVEISGSDEESILVWVTEQSPGGNGSIERIAQELESMQNFDALMHSMLRPRELEKLDSELRILAQFALGSGSAEAEAIRSAWSVGHQQAEIAIQTFKEKLRVSNIFVERSAMAVFLNRFMRPGSTPMLLEFLLSFSSSWDLLESKICFEVSPEIMGTMWQSDSRFDDAIHISNPLPGKRASVMASIAWTRSSNGVYIDYESYHPFNFDFKHDIPALRSMMTTDPAIIGEREIVKLDVGCKDAKRDSEVKPDAILEVVGSPESIRAEIIRSLVVPIEDDALWVHRLVAETRVEDGEFIVRLIGDLDSL